MPPNDQQLVTPDQITIQTPPLHLPIEDGTILSILDDAERRGRAIRSRLKVDDRSKLNREFWQGQQVDQTRLDSRFQMAHVDNVVRQNLENKIKLATGHMPDIFVAPPDKQDFNVESARDLQNALRDRLDSSTIKRLLKNALRKLDLDLTAIIKPRWDKERKDYVFELIDSKNVLFGEGARVQEDGYTIDGTDVLFHYVEEPTQFVLNTFPHKAAELLALLGANGKEIPSRITRTEAHFRWFDQKGACHEGIVWRFSTLILGKMRQPYYDYDNPQINYFDRPRKNFILLSYSNLGESVYETTTDFEQGIPVNRIINRRRRQITEIADRSVPKMVFSGLAMTQEQARNINPSPNEAIILNDTVSDIGKAFATIPAMPPSPILYNDLLDLRGRVDSIFSTHGTIRGEQKNAGESGVSKQITREGDLVTSDDISNIVVERVVSEMAGWGMQFMRLFFDDDRPPLRLTDRDGETEYVELNRKKIETDVQAVVKASTVDKQTRRADALQMLEAKAIDPFSLMEDLDANNPKERLRRLMAFIQAQQSGDFSQYAEIIGVDLQTHMATEEDAQRDIDVLTTGQQVAIKLPSEKYVSTFIAFKNSPEYAQLDDNAKAMIEQHIQRLKVAVNEAIAKKQAEAGVDTGQLASVEAGGPPQMDMAGAFAPPQPANPLMAAMQQRAGGAMQPQTA